MNQKRMPYAPASVQGTSTCFGRRQGAWRTVVKKRWHTLRPAAMARAMLSTTGLFNIEGGTLLMAAATTPADSPAAASAVGVCRDPGEGGPARPPRGVTTKLTKKSNRDGFV